MNILDILFWVVLAVFMLPILSYLIVKFGTVGYLTAKQQHEETQHKTTP